jgi:hypothetical protein
MTTTNSWLPLTEYSNKHRVSISTLRRRIKAEDIKFRFEDGRYLIFDEAPQTKTLHEQHRPSPVSDQNAQMLSRQLKHENEISSISHNSSVEVGESVLAAANKLLIDLKQAYTQILHEKEEQIMYLKEEIVDLKTLIKVLESENAKLRRSI